MDPADKHQEMARAAIQNAVGDRAPASLAEAQVHATLAVAASLEALAQVVRIGLESAQRR